MWPHHTNSVNFQFSIAWTEWNEQKKKQQLKQINEKSNQIRNSFAVVKWAENLPENGAINKRIKSFRPTTTTTRNKWKMESELLLSFYGHNLTNSISTTLPFPQFIYLITHFKGMGPLNDIFRFMHSTICTYFVVHHTGWIR